MIKSITLENFQSHVKTVIEPAPAGQLTALTGQSDTGKTAFIRALRWLFNNTWDASYMRHGAKFARETIEYENGVKVVRERNRSGTVNIYEIIQPGGQKITLARFGNSVPLEVQEITGVKPISVADMEININIAEQGEPWFLTRPVSALARAKVLGKLAGTEEVDMAARSAATDLLRKKQEEKKLAVELTELEGQIRQFDYLPALAERITGLERLVAQIKAALERREKLIYTRKKLWQVDEQIWEADVVIRRWVGVEAAARAANEAEYLIAKKETVCRKRREWFIAEEAIKRSAETVRRWRGLAQAEEKFFAAANAVSLRQRFAKLKDNLGRTQAAINSAESIIARLAGIEQAGEILFAAKEKVERRKLLSGTREKLQRIDSDIELAADICRCWLGVSEAESLLQRIKTAAAQKEKITALAGKLGQVDDSIQKARDAVVLWENRVRELEGAYRDQLAALGICPLCGSKIQKLREVV